MSDEMSGESFKQGRMKLGLSQPKLAALLLVSASTIYNIERAGIVPVRHAIAMRRLLAGEIPAQSSAPLPIPASPLSMAAAAPEPVSDPTSADALPLYNQAMTALAALYRLAKQQAAPRATSAGGRTLYERKRNAFTSEQDERRARVRAHYDRMRAAWQANDWRAYSDAHDALKRAAAADPTGREAALAGYLETHPTLPDLNDPSTAVRVIFD